MLPYMSPAAKGKFRPVDPRPNIDELEHGILDIWEKEKTFEVSLEQNKDKPLFTFYDGPPYATGKPHYGHVLQSAIKDTILRYKTMRGYYVPRRVGWDTHGLPVEVLVEKELGLRTKREVEEYGIEKFNQKCREAVFRYIDEFTATLKRLGRWADYENGYATLDRDYMESEWWVFQRLWEKDLVYKDFRSTPYCIRCATPLSNFETGMGYKDTTDTAVYVLMPIRDQSLFLLVWTTTPWTLPGNAAVAFNPAVSYVSVKVDGKEIIIAKDRVVAVFGEDTEIVRAWSQKELAAMTYEAPYPASEIPADAKNMYTVVPADFVTAEDGTGFVHIAPAFGTDDFELSKKVGLPVIRTINPSGIFEEHIPQWGSQHIWKVNKAIPKDLQARGLLVKEEQYKHSYPHCWRCDEPLIYYALDSWFVRVTQLKEDMLAQNEKISWIPEHLKEGRFAKGIKSAPDWAVSRNRYWSVPIPVWECDSCDHRVCIGSIAELQEKSGATNIEDIHRPYVDSFTWKCERCEGTMKRISEVLDVWFDSGSMPYSQWHYPFENKEFVEKGFPADFIAESIEMTRAWFYVLHVLSTALKESPAYKNVIGSGIIFGEDGNKLSKKLKNYPDVEPTLEKYGADTIRLFFLSSTLGEPYVFSEKDLQQLFRNFTMRLWNVYSFFVQYANTADWEPAKETVPSSEQILDKWILTRIKQLEYVVIQKTDSYRVDVSAREFVTFVDDLSNWYVRRSRERFQPRGEQDSAAFVTLHAVLVRLAKLLAPFMPFLSEELYRNVTGAGSVHLADLSDPSELSQDEQALLSTMTAAREIVSQGLSARAQANIKVRQPLGKLTAPGVDALPPGVIEMIKEEVNVDEVVVGDKLELATEISEELRDRGTAREIIRHGQVLRRTAGYALDDRITLVLSTSDEGLKQVLAKYQEEIVTALQVNEITENGETDTKKEVMVDGKLIVVGVRK